MSKLCVVVGSGAREHALAVRLLESPAVSRVIVTPGNAGTAGPQPGISGKVLESASGDPAEIARSAGADLVVVGPEAPLCDGIADRLSAVGIACFGPSQAAARLEGSKAFMKQFAARHRIPTASFEIVRDPAELEAKVRTFRDAPVVKADGLAAGKGVTVAETHEEAVAVGRRLLSGDLFGDAGRTVVLEERIPGQEASVHLVSDGERFFVLPTAQDHKRIFDGDRGPNTGGMGAYAPAPLMNPELEERVRREILEPAVLGMKEEGVPYRGVLFAGLFVTPAGNPMLVEFNVRFGDPETEVLMNTTGGDLFEALTAAARGELDPRSLEPSGEHALCVVLSAEGYPESPRKGDVIRGVDAASALEGVRVYHAGTARSNGELVTAGGRVLAVTARGASLVEAHERAYSAVERIEFRGMQYRRDIGARALA